MSTAKKTATNTSKSTDTPAQDPSTPAPPTATLGTENLVPTPDNDRPDLAERLTLENSVRRHFTNEGQQNVLLELVDRLFTK